MRRKPTFDDLARASIRESNIGPVKLSYVPPNDASFAITELRETATNTRNEDIAWRNVQLRCNRPQTLLEFRPLTLNN